MSNWLDSSNNSNLLKQSYIKGFIDISGGDLITRNGRLLINNDASLNSNVYVRDKLHVGIENSSYNVDVSGTVKFNNVNFVETTEFSSDVSMLTNLDVIGKTTLSNDVSMNSNVDISGNLAVTHKLFVSEDISLNGKISIDGDSSFNNNVYIGNGLTVSGNILPTQHLQYDIGSLDKSFRDIYMSNGTMHNIDPDGNQSSMSITNGRVSITSVNASTGETITYSVIDSADYKTGLGGILSKDAAFTLDISGDLRTSKDVSFNAELIVGGNTNLLNALSVSATSTLSSTLNVIKSTSLSSTLSVSDTTALSSTLDVVKATSLNDTLSVSGATALSSTLSVSADTTLSSTLHVINATSLKDTLSVSGATALSSTLNVIKDTSLNSTLSVSGATSLSSTLTVTESTTLSSSLNVIKATSLKNTLSVSGATALSSTLNVIKDTSLNSTLSVSGATALNSTLIVTESTTLNSTLNVNKATSLKNTLSVSGATTLSSTLNVIKDTSLNSTLSVSGATALNSTLIVTESTALNSTLIVNKAASLKDTLSVSGATSLSSTLNVIKDTSLNSTLSVSGATALNSTLTVSGVTTLSSTLDVINAASLKNTLSVSGATILSSTIDIDGSVTMKNTLSVSNATTLSSTLSVSGKTLFSQDVSMIVNVDVCGNFYAQYPNTSIPSSAIDGGVLTIQHTSDTGDTQLATDVTYVKTLQFDKDSGFDVSYQSIGVAKIRMNSTFKYWNINGSDGLTAEGLDTVNLISADGITISADNNTDPKSLIIGYDDTATSAAISSKVDLSTDQTIGGNKIFTNDTSFNQDVDITGKLSHKGLAITSGNEIDQIKTITKILSLNVNTWTNTGIYSNIDLTTGIYLLSLSVDDNENGGTHYNETYSGTISWYGGTTNSARSDEITLHRSGENPGTGTIYLRTIRNTSGYLHLQIYSNVSISNNSYVFKFRRFM